MRSSPQRILIKEWSPGPIPSLSCATHHDGPAFGWEDAAYLTHMVREIDSLDPFGLYVFLQGAGPAEFLERSPLGELSMRSALARLLEANASFSTLSGLLARDGDGCRRPNTTDKRYLKFYDDRFALFDGLRNWRMERGALDPSLGCESHGFIRPLRGQFATAGWAILRHGAPFWRWALEQARSRAMRGQRAIKTSPETTIKVDTDPDGDFEAAWSTVFECMHPARVDRRVPATVACLHLRQAADFHWGATMYALGSFDCYARPPAR